MKPPAIVFALCCMTMTRPSAAADESAQLWTSVMVHKAISDEWSLYFDGNWRLFEDYDTSQILLRPGVVRRLTDDLSVYLAYAWTPAWADDGAMTDEHRIWQQLGWSNNALGSFSFYSRSRLEQRFRAHSDVGVRFREFVRLLWKASDLFGISVWDELFIDLNSATDDDGVRWQRFGLDQNRLFIGPTAYLPGRVRVEVGYLNQYIDVTTPNEMRHIGAVNAFVDL